MEILNTYSEITNIGIVFMCISVGAAVPAIMMLFSDCKDETKLTLSFVAIISFGLFLGSMQRCQVTRHEIFLTDMTFYELVEQYDVIDIEGRIIIVEEKGE